MADYSKIKALLSEKPKSKQEAIERDRLERSITTYREEQLSLNPIIGNYDFEHIAKIHHYLFNGLRDYAGQLRTIEPFFKQNDYDLSLVTIFADIDDIIPTINEVSQSLKENNYLKGLDRDDFLYEFSINYAEFNYAHPFEEGNGRATRILFRQLANQAGYEFNIGNIDKQEWVMASTLSCYHGKIYESETGDFEIEAYDESHIDIDKLIAVMDKCLIQK